MMTEKSIAFLIFEYNGQPPGRFKDGVAYSAPEAGFIEFFSEEADEEIA
jgi:hypothetical protein